MANILNNSENNSASVDDHILVGRVERPQQKFEVIHPNLEQLVEFESISWPDPEERATAEDLEKRLQAFPEGIFLLLADGEPVAQITVSPKDIKNPDTINSFERMRDMPVELGSPVLWITNMACNHEFRGRGYVSYLMAEVMKWATEQGYQSIMAGVTCDNFADLKTSGQVENIDEYMSRNLNPGVNTFRAAARRLNQDTGQAAFVWNSDPIADYWPADKASAAYGDMVEVDLSNRDFEGQILVPSTIIFERMSRNHYIKAQHRLYDEFYGRMGRSKSRTAEEEIDVDRFAAGIYDEWQEYRDADSDVLQKRHQTLLDLRDQYYYLSMRITAGQKETMTPEKELEWRKAAMEACYYTDLCGVLSGLIADREMAAAAAEGKPEIKYKYDLAKVNNLGIETRETATGQEQTMFILLCAKGCKMDCDHCSPKHLAAPNIIISAEASAEMIEQIRPMLDENQHVDTLKLFNAGNILWGTEFGKAAALHEGFWDLLPILLSQYPEMKAVEIEARLDEFSEEIVNPKIQSADKKTIVRERILKLKEGLKAVGKELRLILAPEYTDEFLEDQSKTVGKGLKSAEAAINFLRKNEIPWLGYAMFGGRLKDRPMLPTEALQSATETAKFIIDNGAREVIINCQYLDPINQHEERADGIKYFVPSKKSITRLMELLYYKRVIMPGKRVRISIDKEDSIEGTIGAADLNPNIDAEFIQTVNEFNDVVDQRNYLENKFGFFDNVEKPNSFTLAADRKAEDERLKANPGVDILFLDLPFHSDPRLKDSSFSDFGKVQEIPVGALAVATHLGRRDFKTAVVPMDAFIHKAYSDYGWLRPDQVDTNIFINSLRRVLDEQIRKYNPKVIGISYMFSPNRRIMLELISYLKDCYHRPVIIGGNAATLERSDETDDELQNAMLAENTGADAIVNYEGEAATATLMKKLAEVNYDMERADLSDVPGITYFDCKIGQIVNNEPLPRNQRLGQLDPDFDPDHSGGLDYGLLARFEGMDLRDFNNYAIFSRGCKGCCEFCTSQAFWEGAVSPTGLKSFEDEVRQLAEEISSFSTKIERNDSNEIKNNPKFIGLLDDDIFLELDFYQGKYVDKYEKHRLTLEGKSDLIVKKTVFEVIEPILNNIRKDFPDIKFMIQTRYAHFRDHAREDNLPDDSVENKYTKMSMNNFIQNQPEFLRMVKATGVEKIYLGMESGAQNVLDQIKKMSFVGWLVPACQKIKEAGMEVGLFWIIGLPGSNVEAEEETFARIEFLIDHDLIDEFEAHIFVPLPGSKGNNSPLIRKTTDSRETSYISGKPTHVCLDEEGEVTLSEPQMVAYWERAKILTDRLKAKSKPR